MKPLSEWTEVDLMSAVTGGDRLLSEMLAELIQRARSKALRSAAELASKAGDRFPDSPAKAGYYSLALDIRGLQ